MNNLIKINIIQQNNILVVDSRIVAKQLNVNHRDLLEKIDGYIRKFGSAESAASFYIIGKYIHEQNKQEYRMYWITENGLQQLLGGYNSSVPLAFELNVKYIEEFKRMKEQLQNKYKLPSNYKEALKRLLEEVENNEKLQLENQMLKPKSDKYDSHLSKGKTYNASEIAIRFGLGVKKFNKILCDLEIQYKQKENYRLYSQYEGKGYTKYITMEKQLINPDTEELESKEYNSMKWTELGYEFLEKKLLKKKIIKLKEENEKLDDGVRYVSIA